MIRRLLLILIALVGLGGVFVLGLATFAGAEDRATFSQGGPIRQVEVDVEAGRIEIVAHQANEATVERTRRYIWGEPVVRETYADGVLRLHAECRRFIAAGCAVDYRLGLPVAAELRIRTRSGSISVEGMGALIDAETRAGEIRLVRTRGPVQAVTSAGDIEGTDIAARFVDATTDAGRIRLSLSEPSQRMGLETGAGRIDLALPPAGGGYRVTAETGAGEVDVRVAQEPTAARVITASSRAGSIRILPR